MTFGGRRLVLSALLSIFFLTSYAQKLVKGIKEAEVDQIIRTLSADDMQGRASFSPGAARAAEFIESEFKKIGLQPIPGENSLRQVSLKKWIKPESISVNIDGKEIDPDHVFTVSEELSLNWTKASDLSVIRVTGANNFYRRFRELLGSRKDALVLVDPRYSAFFKKLKEHYSAGHIAGETANSPNIVFVLGLPAAKTFTVGFKAMEQELALTNIAGMLPGKSKKQELVIFSGHYDHLGVVEPDGTDSIANGADDDASGVTAVISLAKHYKKLNNNQRSLIFVAFAAEELGGYGSRHFSEKIDPEKVSAMFNIEMIGKRSKFGENTAFITGYDKSDFGSILQKNLRTSKFRFYPDPYPDQNLFYRSDNATLAALGVPAHTISTDQIDRDKYYHTVHDEYNTLDIKNIVATINAIAISSRSIVAGKDTPSRIIKLNKEQK